MFYLINTFNATAPYVGRVISSHRTLDAAREADARIQRGTRRWSGDRSYLPTSIVQVRGKARKGDWVEDSDIIPAAEW